MRTEAKDVVTPYLIHMKCKCVCFLKKNSNENYLFLALSSSFSTEQKKDVLFCWSKLSPTYMYNLKNWLWFCYTTIYSIWHMIKIYDLFVLNDGHCEGHIKAHFPSDKMTWHPSSSRSRSVWNVMNIWTWTIMELYSFSIVKNIEIFLILYCNFTISFVEEIQSRKKDAHNRFASEKLIFVSGIYQNMLDSNCRS